MANRPASCSSRGSIKGSATANRRATIRPEFADVIAVLSELAADLCVTEDCLTNPTPEFISSVWVHVLRELNIDTSYIGQPAILLPNCQPDLYEGSFQYLLLYRTMSEVMKDFGIEIHFMDLLKPKTKRTVFLLRQLINVLECVLAKADFVLGLTKAKEFKEEKYMRALESESQIKDECERLKLLVAENEPALQQANLHFKNCKAEFNEGKDVKDVLLKKVQELQLISANKQKEIDEAEEIKQGLEKELVNVRSALVKSPERLERGVETKRQELADIKSDRVTVEAHDKSISRKINFMSKWLEVLNEIEEIHAKIAETCQEIKEKQEKMQEMKKVIDSREEELSKEVSSKNLKKMAKKEKHEKRDSMKAQHVAKMKRLQQEEEILQNSMDTYMRELGEKEVALSGLRDEVRHLTDKKLTEEKSVLELRDAIAQTYERENEKNRNHHNKMIEMFKNGQRVLSERKKEMGEFLKDELD